MASKIDGVFEKDLQEKINSSRILVVGAGGIGCEILKNLVLCGFNDIEIIDLDTIDVSNLNRQFLFHKEHVGKSKAKVARESALSFNPNVKIKAIHDSVMGTEYTGQYFKGFNVVLNALDNRAARNHVNRLCLSARIPLIESGTAGYNGQVELIKRGETQCYECTPKSAQKTYPGCTIRNTPSEPIHCIVWAKHLFNQLFGECNEDEEVSPDQADPEAGEVHAVIRQNTRTWAAQIEYDAEKIFNKVFYEDIRYLLKMENLWKNRRAPNPIEYGQFNEFNSIKTDDNSNNTSNLLPDQQIWDLAKCAQIFTESIKEIRDRYKLTDGELAWDKDEKNDMDFVAACANIRSIIYGIPQKSRFEIKSMAGNIIPAIATTNAITAGIVVMRTFKVLQEQFEKCQSVYIRLVPNPRNQLFVPERTLVGPNPKCMVCAPQPEITIKIDVSQILVKEFRDDVLIKGLNMIAPDVIIDGKGTIVISSDADETVENDLKTLTDVGITNGVILKVDDFIQEYQLTITVLHEKKDARTAEIFELIADPNVVKPKSDNGKVDDAPTASTSTKSADNGKAAVDADDDDDDMCIIDEDNEHSTSANDIEMVTAVDDGEASSSASTSTAIKSPPKKRKTGDEDAPSAKRNRIAEKEDDDDLIAIDEPL